MPDRTDLVYLCEESLEGTLCCVYESYTRREVPFDILPEGTPTLYPSRPVVSDEAHAARVWRSLLKLDPEAAAWVRDGWCSCLEGREYRAYRFIRALYAHGPRIMGNLADPDVGEFFKLVRFQRNEAHLMKEFLRFADYGGALVSVIEPKALILESLAPHFTGRFPEEQFMIFDKTHGFALFYRPYEWVVRPVSELALPVADAQERNFRALWRRYYDRIGIEGRYNPKCRMTHMYKRFWKNMLEMDRETGVLRANERAPLDGPSGPPLRLE